MLHAFKGDLAMQCLVSQFALLHIVFGGELEELGFDNLYFNL